MIRLLIYREIPIHGPCQAHTFRSFQAGQRDLRGDCGRETRTSTTSCRSPVAASTAGKMSWVLCKACNSRKADRTPLEAGMTLKVRPYAPKDRVSLVLGVGKVEVVPDWEPFLAIAQ